VRAGKLDPSALEGRRLTAGRDRARAAREQGLLTQRDWRWGEKIRAVEILAELLTWLEGRYSFDPDEIPEAGEFRVGIERLLLELFLRSRDREFIHHSLGATDAPLQRAADFDEAFPALGLTPDAVSVVSAIDGRTTAAEISRRVPPDPFSVQKLLAALTTLGLVHPEYAAEAKPRRVAATPPPAQVPAPTSTPSTPKEAPRPEPAEPAAPAPQEPAPAKIESEISAAPSAPDEAPIEEPPVKGFPIELPMEPVPEPAEPEPAILGWEQGPLEPLDQPLDFSEPVLHRSGRPSLTPVWVLAVLAIAVGALLVSRARRVRSEPPATPVVAATPLPTLLPTEPPAVTAAPPTAFAASGPAETPSPTVMPATPIPPTATAPTTTIVPTRLPRPSPPPAAAGAVPRDRRGWLERAESDRRALAESRSMQYTIQLELVCELPSLEEAWNYDRGRAMWLLVSTHRGRECFRVLWGRYATLEAARSAKASVPRFFFTPTNQPTVVSARSLVP
jgi:septal ring-binding cell division protein DamX